MTFLTSNKGIKLLFTLVLILSFTLFQSCEPEEEVIAQGLDDENRALAQGQFVELTNGKVHYEMSGDENAQTVVLLHGYSVPMYIWDNTFNPLVEAGFRVLRLDFYGRGFSDRRDLRYDKDLYIAQVSELLEALNITGPVDLVGMSMGGSIAVAFTDQYPEKVRKLLFIDTEFSSGSPPLPPDYMTTGVKLMREQAESMAEGQLGDFYNPDNFPGWPDKYKVQMQYEGFFRALISTSMYFYLTNFQEIYKRVGQQGRDILIVWGKNDMNIPVEVGEMVQSALPGSQMVVIDEAGHLPHYEQPDKVNPVLIEFLKK